MNNYRELSRKAATAHCRKLTQSPDLLTVAEAAEYLRVCTKTIRTLIKKGALPCRQAGSQYRLLRRDLDNYLGLERPR